MNDYVITSVASSQKRYEVGFSNDNVGSDQSIFEEEIFPAMLRCIVSM